MISPNKMIGSLVFRTREALNKNEAFISKMKSYYYSQNCFVNDQFLLWHYPGTNNEISNALLEIGKHPNGSRIKFPSFLNFQPVRQEKQGSDTTIHYNLAIVGSVKSEWLTEQRENEVFEKILRPVYEEFMRQLQGSRYLKNGYGLPGHTYYEIFTTGESSGEIIKRYGDNIDAIEIHNLVVDLKTRLCKSDLETIELENAAVTANIKEILNYKKNDRTNKK